MYIISQSIKISRGRSSDFVLSVETRGSTRLGHSSKVSSCSVVELRSRSRDLCPQSLPPATRLHAKDGPIAFHSLKRMGLAWCNCFPWLCPCLAQLPQCVLRTAYHLSWSLLCSGHCSVLVTPGFSSTLPPWLQALKWFPKLDSAQLAQLQASLITAWFTKQRHVLFNS